MGEKPQDNYLQNSWQYRNSQWTEKTWISIFPSARIGSQILKWLICKVGKEYCNRLNKKDKSRGESIRFVKQARRFNRINVSFIVD